MDFLILEQAEEFLHIHIAAADHLPFSEVAQCAKLNVGGEMCGNIQKLRIIRRISVAAYQDGERRGMRYGKIDAGSVCHLVIQIYRNDVVGAGHHSFFHFGGIGAECKAWFQFQILTHLVKQFILKTNGAAFV